MNGGGHWGVSVSLYRYRVRSMQLDMCYDFATVFYHAMHFSAKRGIAIACRLSVRPSVRLSVCDVGGL